MLTLGVELGGVGLMDSEKLILFRYSAGVSETQQNRRHNTYADEVVTRSERRWYRRGVLESILNQARSPFSIAKAVCISELSWSH
jgi:hypothetical protein